MLGDEGEGKEVFRAERERDCMQNEAGDSAMRSNDS